jgi:hypothetical protein
MNKFKIVKRKSNLFPVEFFVPHVVVFEREVK